MDTESGGQAGSSAHFHAAGPKPAPAGGFNDHPAASASEQAFGGNGHAAPAPDPHWMQVAKRYNAEHPDHVSQFNSATHDRFVIDGALDLHRIVAFQQQHGLRGDGMLGPHTVNAAHHTARATPGAQQPHPSAEGSAMAAELFREVNGGPGEKSPTTPSGKPIATEHAAQAPVPAAPHETPEPAQPTAQVTSAPVANPATPSAPVAAHPSAEGSAVAAQLFREVNGGPGEKSPTTPSGAPKVQVHTGPQEPPHDVPNISTSAGPTTPAPAPTATPATPPQPQVADGQSQTPAPAPAKHAEAPSSVGDAHSSGGQQPAAPGTAAPATAGGAQGWDAPDANGQFTGAHELHISQMTRGQVYDSISRVAPSYPHAFKVMMVGHSWIEQHGKAINNNYMGVEFANPNKPGAQAYTYVRTSTMVSRKEYDAHPEKYTDWKVGPADRNTIQQQLDRNEPLIYCNEMRNRPAYQNIDGASQAFVHGVQWRLGALQGSAKPEHQQLAQDALGGDEDAYAKMMTMRDKSIGISPYNTDAHYPARMIVGINEARGDNTLTSRD